MDQDVEKQERFVRQVDAGAVFVSGMTTSYPAALRRSEGSGYGRELPAYVIRAFCNRDDGLVRLRCPESTTPNRVSPHPARCHRHGKFVATRAQV